jgi:hypothetical protein
VATYLDQVVWAFRPVAHTVGWYSTKYARRFRLSMWGNVMQKFLYGMANEVVQKGNMAKE